MLLGCRARAGVAGPVWGAGLRLSLVRGQLSRISLGRMQPLGRVRHRNGLNEVCPCCADVPGALGTGCNRARSGSRTCCMPGAWAVQLHRRSYCRDLTIALRAWGVSGTEGDAL